MRKLIYTLVTAATVIAAGLFAAPRAEAMTIPAPAGLAEVVQELSGVEDVRYVCRRVYTRYGWRSRCWWTGGRYYYRRHYHRRYYHRHYRRW